MFFIYDYKVIILATLFENTFKLENLPMNQQELVFNKGVRNILSFSLRNEDRKKIPSHGRTFFLNIVNSDKTEQLLRKELTVVNEQDGSYQVIVDSSESIEWPLGRHIYGLVSVDDSGQDTPLYLDQNFNTTGIVKITDGSTFLFKDSLLLDTTDFTIVSTLVAAEQDFRVSTRLAANREGHTPDPVHTFAYYTDDFSGKLWVEGSLENEPSVSSSDWFEIKLGVSDNFLTLSSSTGVDTVTLTESIPWIRFKYQPDDLASVDKITKILYRN